MYGLKQLSVLSFLLLSAYAAKEATHTTVGIETAAGSRGIKAPLDDCYDDIDEEEVFTVAIKKYCRIFTGVGCTGRNTVLAPGDHSSKDPVPVGAIYCHSTRPY
ncbi:hypothetical protein N7509_013915 [Penicillium cosmopolitanum]|uniref:Uncharacterized protein n=1 Tax=Penicillium cosmopolitanum TaxID=1131564 RepID=A0A9W9SGX6_9EURO|nr:uncharacterized protein N7509_013915 [Penicillium cosmopolitanum]XP_057116699.1 uncharacterized protein N7481_013292 [Penicillium waksmanii]KAJ5377029.1 hypothetical protein N7509_013915 [Penicillium cosmopolitanum]KAJ5966578.1 hypothetical protein N7481_013292 [Penicillium waksmanii]